MGELELENTLPFGKYKGKLIRWVILNDVNYILWAVTKANLNLSKEALNKVITTVYYDNEDLREDSMWASEVDIY